MADKEELPKKGSKEFWERGLKKLAKDAEQLAQFTPGGLTKKLIKKVAGMRRFNRGGKV